MMTLDHRSASRIELITAAEVPLRLRGLCVSGNALPGALGRRYRDSKAENELYEPRGAQRPLDVSFGRVLEVFASLPSVIACWSNRGATVDEVVATEQAALSGLFRHGAQSPVGSHSSDGRTNVPTPTSARTNPSRSNRSTALRIVFRARSGNCCSSWVRLGMGNPVLYSPRSSWLRRMSYACFQRALSWRHCGAGSCDLTMRQTVGGHALARPFRARHGRPW